MREILFRGKTDSGKWVEGTYFPPANTLISYQHELIDGVNTFMDFCVIPKTVGQYTGLIDKNGKKIFEGDIIKADNGHIGFVTFHNGSFVKCCFCHVESINDIYGDNETIIGNKYDNPELLESDEYSDKIQ